MEHIQSHEIEKEGSNKIAVIIIIAFMTACLAAMAYAFISM
jgi:flagellar basal body-associated protein FliL